MDFYNGACLYEFECYRRTVVGIGFYTLRIGRNNFWSWEPDYIENPTEKQILEALERHPGAKPISPLDGRLMAKIQVGTSEYNYVTGGFNRD